MPTEIGYEEVRRMVENGAQLVEVLPKEEYEAEHLPRAIHIPLQQLDRQTTAALQQDQPVIVYIATTRSETSAPELRDGSKAWASRRSLITLPARWIGSPTACHGRGSALTRLRSEISSDAMSPSVSLATVLARFYSVCKQPAGTNVSSSTARVSCSGCCAAKPSMLGLQPQVPKNLREAPWSLRGIRPTADAMSLSSRLPCSGWCRWFGRLVPRMK